MNAKIYDRSRFDSSHPFEYETDAARAEEMIRLKQIELELLSRQIAVLEKIHRSLCVGE